jgi:tetratricopeptide (TPR) repeat protein
LENAVEEYSDVRVKALGKVITRKEGSEVAREEGKKRKAAIVIWGWYGKTKDTIPISTNFELLTPPKYFPDLGDEASGQLRTAPAAELESFKIQTCLSQEMTYLTLVALGMSRYATDDWDGAIDRFTNALKQIKELTSTIGQADVYLYRGNSYLLKRDFERAIADYNQALKLKPDYAEAYGNRRGAYYNKKDFERAIADFNQALKLKPDLAEAYIGRGLAYYDKKDFERAITDYTQALQLKPDYAGAYNNRGNAYRDKGDKQNAMKDFQKVLELTKDPELRQKAEQELRQFGVK